MTDDATATAPLAGRSYDGRKSGSGAGSDRGFEGRVRAVRRRNWATEDRLRIVRETLEPGAVVQAVADRHGVSTGQLYTWRKQMLATAMAGFVPVEAAPDPPRLEAPDRPVPPAAAEVAGRMEVGPASGPSLRVTGAVYADTPTVEVGELGGG